MNSEHEQHDYSSKQRNLLKSKSCLAQLAKEVTAYPCSTSQRQIWRLAKPFVPPGIACKAEYIQNGVVKPENLVHTSAE